MLSTDYADFKVNRNGVMDIKLKGDSIAFSELIRILKMAVMHARRKKIKKPTKWRMARL